MKTILFSLALLLLSGCTDKENEPRARELGQEVRACNAKGMYGALRKGRGADAPIRVECVPQGDASWSTSDE